MESDVGIFINSDLSLVFVTDNTYRKTECYLYHITRIVVCLGTVLGAAMQVVGFVNNDSRLLRDGAYLSLPLIGYTIGTFAGESRFSKDSSLENKLK